MRILNKKIKKSSLPKLSRIVELLSRATTSIFAETYLFLKSIQNVREICVVREKLFW